MNDLLHEWVRQHRLHRNFVAASHELKLTPQERYAYQHHLSNLARGGVPHDDGSVSSFLNMTVGLDGKTYVLPRVWDNQIIDENAAIERARADGLDKWPSYPDDATAEARYQAMHDYMERDTGMRLNANPVSKPTRDPHTGKLEGPQSTGSAGVDR